MITRNSGDWQFARTRPSRARVLWLARILLLLAGILTLALILAPMPAAAQGCTWQGPYICTDRLPNGAMGGSYSEQIPYLCPQAWCDFWLPGSSPPTGMTVAPSGLVTGGPLPAPGTYSFEVVLCGHNHPACWVVEERIMWLTVDGTNHQPTFTPGGDLALLEDDPPYSAIWATGISKGGPEDVGQTLTFHVSNNNHALFSLQPAIAADGTLSFTLAPDANGVATVSVYLEDNGGIANGGINHSPTATFQIDVTPVDSVETGPVFTVNTTDWTTDHVCTEENCTLREAIEAANAYGGNNPSGPASTIELAAGATYAVEGVDNLSQDESPNGLPQITANLTINGHGARIARSDAAPEARLIDVGGGFVTLNEVTLENGRAGLNIYSHRMGGAILDRGQLVVKNCYFVDNYAEYGGAIYNPGGPRAWIYNSTFYANSGGAIHSDGALDLYSNTFLDNTGVTAAAVRAYSYTSYLKMNLYNNVFASSSTSAPLCDIAAGRDILTVGGNLATDNTCAGSAVTTYAALKAVKPPDYNGGLTPNAAIEVGSSAIDAGNAAACQNADIAGRDQRGKPRFVDGNGDGVAQCDVGAYEFSAPQSPPPSEPETDAPQVSVLLSPAAPDGSNGWYRSPVTVQPQASDASPVIDLRCALDPASPPATFDDLPEEICTFLGGAPTSTDGEHVFYAAAMDIWGNKSAVVAAGFRLDATPPVITCPVDGPFLLHSGEHTVGPAGVDAGISGLDEAASTLSVTIATEGIGPHTLTFLASDLAGNSASQECTYAVIYDFGGFYPPVEPGPAWNEARAGRSVSLKFSLAGDQGLAVLAAGFPASQAIDCSTQQPAGDLEPAGGPGQSRLSYASGNGWYHYEWKTDRAWAGTCRALVVQLIDGTEHLAYFNFR